LVGSRLQARRAGSPFVPATLNVLVLAQAERYLVDLEAADFTLQIVSDLHSPDLSRADLLIVEASEQDEGGPVVDVQLPVLVLVPPERQVSPSLDARRSSLAVPGRRDQLEVAILAAARGLVVHDPALVRSAQPELAEALTAREREVLLLLARGDSNAAIATALGLRENTVKTHVTAIFGKLGAHTRTEAVAVAARRGLVML
jgi:DNA-binding NarL/FixJ family response regulator